MEIETKAKTKNLEKIKKKLIKLGAKFEKTIFQKDEYYKKKGFEAKTQKPGSYIIRIREEPGKSWLTIKVLTKTTGAWLEHETQISNPKETRKILKLAGFTKTFTKTKERTPGKLGKIGVCLDKIKGLGNYTEFEIISKDAKTAKKKINELIKRLGLSEKVIEHRGYAAIIQQKMGIKFEGTKG